MHASQAVGLGQKLDVVCDLVATVQTAVLARLVRDLEKAVDLLLVDTHAAGKLRQSGVCLVACLMDDVDIEVLVLLVEERLAELPELVGVGLQDCNTCFVNKRRGRVPWLDLLAEDELHVLGVLGLDQWEDRVVDCVEHLLGELAEL